MTDEDTWEDEGGPALEVNGDIADIAEGIVDEHLNTVDSIIETGADISDRIDKSVSKWERLTDYQKETVFVLSVFIILYYGIIEGYWP